ncbi:MAG: L-2-amino-thiazoline-4-carboxylic acid hydrolase [Chloroflexi bacterium]|nr:L-2-amino-thiazoline-4-carboxylic acid hydrolase [Chloroflexota bacterium]
MSDGEKARLDAERKWRYMIPISHEFYIYGRKAAEELLPAGQVARFVEAFWRISGEETARMYLELAKLDPSDLFGLVRAIGRSSEIMGEDAEAKQEGDRAYLIHHGCPWPKSYQQNGLPESCQGGCDTWFETIAAVISPQIRVRTISAIPSGSTTCTREFWIEASRIKAPQA